MLVYLYTLDTRQHFIRRISRMKDDIYYRYSLYSTIAVLFPTEPTFKLCGVGGHSVG